VGVGGGGFEEPCVAGGYREGIADGNTGINTRGGEVRCQLCELGSESIRNSGRGSGVGVCGGGNGGKSGEFLQVLHIALEGQATDRQDTIVVARYACVPLVFGVVVRQEEQIVVVVCHLTIYILCAAAERVAALCRNAPKRCRVAELDADIMRADGSDGYGSGAAQLLGDTQIMVVESCEEALPVRLEHERPACSQAVVVGRLERPCEAGIVFVGLHEVEYHGIAQFGVESDVVVLLVTPDLPHEGVGITVVKVTERALDAQVRHLILGAGVDAAVTLQGAVLECQVPDDMVLSHTVAPAEPILLGAHAAADGVAREVGIEQLVVGVLHPAVALGLPPRVARIAKDTADTVDVVHGVRLHTETAILHTRDGHGGLRKLPLQIRLRGSRINEQRGYYGKKDVQGMKNEKLRIKNGYLRIGTN